MATSDATPSTAPPARHQGALSVLIRVPVFRRLWAGITLSSLGDWLGLLATTALAAYLTRHSSDIVQGAAISGVLVTRLLPDLILSPVAGALVDRFDRRKVAIVCDLFAGAVYLVIALAGNLTVLLVGQFLVEAVGLFSTPAKQAMWVNIVPRERLAVANQLNYVSIYGMVPVASLVFALLSTVAQFFGTASDQVVESSGLIAGSTSSAAVVVALIFNAGTFVVSASIIYFSRRMIPPFVGERTATRSVFTLVREGISFVKNSRVMRALYLGILGAFGAGGLVAGVAQSYVGTLGAGNAGYGILFGSVFTGLALGMLVGPKVLPAVARRVVFTAAIGMAGLMLLVMSLVPDFVGAVITAAVMGLAAGVAWITGFTMIGHEVSDQLRGRVFAFVMSSVRLILLGAIAVGPVLAGAIGGHTLIIGEFEMHMSGPGIVLAVGGLVAVVVSLIAGRQVGGMRNGVVSRILRRRRWVAADNDRPGVVIAVEGADSAANRVLADAVTAQLITDGWRTISEHSESWPADSYSSLAEALRASATLADQLATRIEPELAAGAVVVYTDYLDSLVVRFGAQGGLDEERLLRVGRWATRGAWADLTILVDPDSAPAGLRVAAEPAGTGRADEPVDTGRADEPVDTGGADELAAAAGPARSSTRSSSGEAVGGSAEPGDGVTGVATGTLETAIEKADEAPPVTPERDPDAGDVDPAQEYRERAASAPEHYLRVAPLSGDAELPVELVERIASVLRVRNPARVVPSSRQA